MVLFFHPVMWLCGRAMRREAEAACDDAVIAVYGGSAAYADSLVRVAEFNGGLTRRLLVNTFAATESNLGRRVRRILDGRTGRMTLGLGLASVAALALIGCLGLPTAAQRKSAPAKPVSPVEDTKKMATASNSQAKHGFRYDPMQYVERGTSVEAAKVRTFVLNRPAAGDKEILQAAIDKILAKQAPDGSFGKTSRSTAEQLTAALELGLSPDTDAARRAADAIVRLFHEGQYEKAWYQKGELLGVDETRALCLMGRGDLPEVWEALTFLAIHPAEYIGPAVGCPWTPEGFIKTLWAGRNVVDTTAAVDAGLEWIEKNIEPSGCLAYRDPCGLLDCAGYIDRPAARRIVQKEIPLILRGQDPNGGWDSWNLHIFGNHSFVVLRALAKHGLLEDLRKKPPLPPDWRIVRSIPAPEGKVWGLAWDGRQLWTCERQANLALAISSEDGHVIKSVPLPDGTGRGLGVWDGALAYTTGKPWTKDSLLLYKLDAGNGKVLQTISFDNPKTWPLETMHMAGVAQVGARIWVVDSYSGAIVSVDPARPEERQMLRMAGPLSIAIAPAGDAVWTIDGWSPYIIKSDLEGRYLACGERPFAGSADGLAWDGRQLWALDADNHRICVIERTETAPAEVAATKGVREQGEPIMAEKRQDPTAAQAGGERETRRRQGVDRGREGLEHPGDAQFGARGADDDHAGPRREGRVRGTGRGVRTGLPDAGEQGRRLPEFAALVLRLAVREQLHPLAAVEHPGPGGQG